MTNKRILLFIDSLHSGGAQRQFVGLAVALHQMGYQVKVITYWNLPFYAPLLEEAGVDYSVETAAARHWSRPYYIHRAIRRTKPDVVIAYMETPSILAALSRMISLKKWKLIVSERNTSQGVRLKDHIRFFLFRWANWIVPNSYSQADYIQQHFPSAGKRVHTITNFVDLQRFSPAPQPATKAESEPRTIVCVGRVAPQKNILRFLEAIKMLKDQGLNFHVEWYGNRFEDYAQLCDAKIDELDIQDKFAFHPQQFNITAAYRNADLFCLPSLYEGFPNVLCEAMACGLPVAASKVCDNPRILPANGSCGLLFNPLSAPDMAAALAQLITQPRTTLATMGKAARTHSEQHFALQTFLNKYINLINN